jgi:HlyD family secretion protein
VTEFKVDVKLDPSSYKDLVAKNPGTYPFRPGMTASLEILTNHKDNVLSIPLSAVASRSMKKEDKKADKKETVDQTEAEKRREEAASQKSEVVFVFSGGKVEMRKVKSGIADFEQVEILDGLKEGEKIVTGPFTAITKTLENGDDVQLRSKDQKKGKSASVDL